ncbi:Uncharacterised protein [Legionella steigerwaltii]|uniref:Uncharacterized protein n=1 Tax=Legionella steigerwaltii TaxID=460 RepID=A0A378L6P0_9GAMM|nr:hypothetical protein [Legionella steigerwaltii]KTD80295.1 hypothetical protein Lstg_0557 [Legionella steigerwaltii]STY22377.1 Uncharacterised protein [Legionella steigerwaltii]
MQSKLAFFASSDHFSLDDFDSAFRKLVLSAYAKRLNSVADARLYLALCGIDLESTVKILLSMEKTGMLNTSIAEAIFAPVGCGDIANTFCKMMTGDIMITGKKEVQSLTPLIEALEKDLPKIIRIDIPGHSYVMLACEKKTEGIWGYIYQSNVAYEMEDNSFSLAAWLMDEKSCKTNLSEHLQKVARLIDPVVSNSEKESIYLELYSAKPIVDVKVPANIKGIVSYINENMSFQYTIKSIRAIDMLHVAKRIQNIISQHPEEQQQSLESYISRMRVEIESDEEFHPVTEPS